MTQKTNFQTHIDHAAIDAACQAYEELADVQAAREAPKTEEEALARKRARQDSYAECLRQARCRDAAHAEDVFRAMLSAVSCQPAEDAQRALLCLAIAWDAIREAQQEGLLDEYALPSTREMLRSLWAVREFLVEMGANADVPSIDILMPFSQVPHRRVAAVEQAFKEDAS